MVELPRPAHHPALSRRKFLGVAGAAMAVTAASLTVPAQAAPIYALHPATARSLTIFNTHTGETLGGTYWSNGTYNSKVLRQFCYLLRDFRAGQETLIDPRLFDLISHLQLRLRNTDTVQLISGYRSPTTNNQMALEGHAVAKNSYHTRGMAMDIRLPSHSLAEMENVALNMRAGGVGVYPKSDFLHMDTGPVRNWGGV